MYHELAKSVSLPTNLCLLLSDQQATVYQIIYKHYNRLRLLI
nr:unnamed protein product [Callosobruchus chinensis]